MRIAVLLVNIGGVRSYWKYPAFLFRMFMDKVILSLPFPLRLVVASLISSVRPVFVLPKYIKVGGSPLISIMEKQAFMLEEALRKDLGANEVRVFPANLYSEPLLSKIVKKISNYDRVVVIPQFPQFSTTTTGAILNRIKDFPFDIVKSYYAHPLFIKLWSETVSKVWKGEHVIFSAHSIPEKIVRRGDPYPEQVRESAALIARKIGLTSYSVAFQSKIGPVKWLAPTLEEELMRLSSKEDEVLIVPISFLNEHLETLYDLDIEYKKLAYKLGYRVYKRAKVPWDSPVLIELFKSLVLEVLYA